MTENDRYSISEYNQLYYHEMKQLLLTIAIAVLGLNIGFSQGTTTQAVC